jgi:signal transduction histidine kinase
MNTERPLRGIDLVADKDKLERLILQFHNVLLVLASLAILTVVFQLEVEWKRIANIASYLAVLVTSRWVLKRNLQWGVISHVIGVWVINSVFIVKFAGIHSVNMLVFPILISLAGWSLGRRWFLSMLAATILFVLVLAAAEMTGYYQPSARAPVPVVAISILVSLLGSGFLMQALFSDFAEGRSRLTALTQELEDRNQQLMAQNTALTFSEAQVRELNRTLESRVDERTAALQQALTQLQQSQASLARADRMAALGTLVAGISHELNTPIGNSVMSASTLRDRVKLLQAAVERGDLRRSELDTSMGQFTQAADLVLRNLERAAHLLGSFKQVSVDQTSEVRRQFDLATVINDVLATIAPSQRGSRHQLHVQIPEGLILDSFPGPLGQVIINLVQNAHVHGLEGMGEAGAVSIMARAREPDLETAGVELTVSDNGRGIDPAHLSRVFEPFFTTRMGSGGTGLGLSIVHNIVHDVLKGQIEVSSQPGKGSRFILHLPLSVDAKA